MNGHLALVEIETRRSRVVPDRFLFGLGMDGKARPAWAGVLPAKTAPPGPIRNRLHAKILSNRHGLEQPRSIAGLSAPRVDAARPTTTATKARRTMTPLEPAVTGRSGSP